MSRRVGDRLRRVAVPPAGLVSNAATDGLRGVPPPLARRGDAAGTSFQLDAAAPEGGLPPGSTAKASTTTAPRRKRPPFEASIVAYTAAVAATRAMRPGELRRRRLVNAASPPASACAAVSAARATPRDAALRRAAPHAGFATRPERGAATRGLRRAARCAPAALLVAVISNGAARFARCKDGALQRQSAICVVCRGDQCSDKRGAGRRAMLARA